MNYYAPFSIGFRSGLSTVTQLVETIDHLCIAVDACMQIDVIFIDFSKAFDRVSHHKLLFKLRDVGISENVLSWIRAYLSNRQQAVRVGDAMSGNREVYSGVPQGSVLGPLLFLLYIDDALSVVQLPVKIKLFADDCLIYCPVSCRENQVNINQCLQTLNLWCSKWGMEINIKNPLTHT